MSQANIAEEPKKGITGKAIVWYVIAQAVMFGYFWLIDMGLMKVQGLDFCYLNTCFWPLTLGN